MIHPDIKFAIDVFPSFCAPLSHTVTAFSITPAPWRCQQKKKALTTQGHCKLTERSQAFFSAFALNSSLIFSTSTVFNTGLKFCIFSFCLLTAAADLSLRFFLLSLVTAMAFLLKRIAKISGNSCIANNLTKFYPHRPPDHSPCESSVTPVLQLVNTIHCTLDIP